MRSRWSSRQRTPSSLTLRPDSDPPTEAESTSPPDARLAGPGGSRGAERCEGDARDTAMNGTHSCHPPIVGESAEA